VVPDEAPDPSQITAAEPFRARDFTGRDRESGFGAPSPDPDCRARRLVDIAANVKPQIAGAERGGEHARR